MDVVDDVELSKLRGRDIWPWLGSGYHGHHAKFKFYVTGPLRQQETPESISSKKPTISRRLNADPTVRSQRAKKLQYFVPPSQFKLYRRNDVVSPAHGPGDLLVLSAELVFQQMTIFIDGTLPFKYSLDYVGSCTVKSGSLTFRFPLPPARKHIFAFTLTRAAQHTSPRFCPPICAMSCHTVCAQTALPYRMRQDGLALIEFPQHRSPQRRNRATRW